MKPSDYAIRTAREIRRQPLWCREVFGDDEMVQFNFEWKDRPAASSGMTQDGVLPRQFLVDGMSWYPEPGCSLEDFRSLVFNAVLHFGIMDRYYLDVPFAIALVPSIATALWGTSLTIGVKAPTAKFSCPHSYDIDDVGLHLNPKILIPMLSRFWVRASGIKHLKNTVAVTVVLHGVEERPA